jgi:hypothetical protein
MKTTIFWYYFLENYIKKSGYFLVRHPEKIQSRNFKMSSADSTQFDGEISLPVDSNMQSVHERLLGYYFRMSISGRILKPKILLGLVLKYWSKVSDLLVIRSLIHSGDLYWSYFLLYFTLAPALVKLAHFVRLYVKGVIHLPSLILKFFTALLFLDEIIAVLEIFKRDVWNASTLVKAEYIRGYTVKISLFHTNMIDLVFDTFPSTALQLYISFMVPGLLNLVLVLSLLSGSISMGFSVFGLRTADEQYGRFGFLTRRHPLLAKLCLFSFSVLEVKFLPFSP